jgi:hypothetical protein
MAGWTAGQSSVAGAKANSGLTRNQARGWEVGNHVSRPSRLKGSRYGQGYSHGHSLISGWVRALA